MLAVSQFSLVSVDFILLILSLTVFLEGEDFYCYNNNSVFAANNGGAAFLMCYTLLLFLYSFTIWLIFYMIPAKYKLLSKKSIDPLSIS